jgi:N-acetylglucosaminyldiphosphoundecaprenol N-acetyl-beta-D-mannosaminyltransferase
VQHKKPDLSRPVHALLGLPFDALTLSAARDHLARAALQGKTCSFATPNLNFLVAAQRDVAFRDAVLNSDLSLPDGMPVVWIAKLLGAPICERVAGSDVVDSLQHSEGPPISVYFFGGPPGIAQQAAERLNQEHKRLRCVGYESPGFGSIADMSTPESIERINQSGAQFLIVSLGAAKGHAWIERNLELLNAPVVSHLGAVVNFVSGRLDRAPKWMQQLGLEWLWRIREEPVLWKRYAKDLFGLARLAVMRILPLLFIRLCMPSPVGARLQFRCTKLPNAGCLISLHGYALGESVIALKTELNNQLASTTPVTLDCSDLKAVDTGFAGALLLMAHYSQQSSFRFRLVDANWKVKNYLAAQGIGRQLFS